MTVSSVSGVDSGSVGWVAEQRVAEHSPATAAQTAAVKR
jgi:hypothetical protein